MTEQEAAAARTAEAWRRVFARFAESRERLASIVMADQKPPGSLRELDERDACGRFIFELSGGALGNASDHLEAWRVFRQEAGYQPVFAHATLVRTALEASCLCRWLVDPSKSSAIRVERGVKAQLDDWKERGHWEGDWKIGRGPRVGSFVPGAERYEALLASVGPVSTPVEHKRTADKFAMEASIDICDRYARAGKLRGNGFYRLVSAFAHAKQWSIVAGMFSIEDPAGTGQTQGPRRLTASEDLAFVLTGCTVRTFATAVRELDGYVASGGAARANVTRTTRPSRDRRRRR